MKNFIIILSIFFSSFIFSQIKNCSVDNIQLETYDFVLNNLNRINKKIENKNSLIQTSIDFKKHSLEEINKTVDTEIEKINYFLISPENSYNGENKKKIKVHSKLNNFLIKKINYCINNTNEFKESIYGNITFRIPLNKKNIEKAIEEVKTNYKMNLSNTEK